ncbi:MAG: putative metal-dependent hydrolase [Saprospiraceae bacterium]|nr:putative metal-dependent hydrolase [Saprospiraceae bacterium]
MEMEHLKYPIGKWAEPKDYSTENIQNWIADIRGLPGNIESLLQQRGDEVFSYRYRPGGWTLRQLIHHIADSHMNAYIRHKLAFTENQPRINAYLEQEWAQLDDVEKVPVATSVQLLSMLHVRWTVFLDSVQYNQWENGFIHPQHNRFISLKESLSMYAWHSRHHLEHIKIALSKPS